MSDQFLFARASGILRATTLQLESLANRKTLTRRDIEEAELVYRSAADGLRAALLGTRQPDEEQAP